MFRNTGLTGNNTIANLNGENGLKSGGTWSKSIKILGRSGDERTANNAVRTKLLEALGRAFGLERDMAAGEDGKMRFSKAFMDRLEDLLGAAAFKRSDFGIDETGLVTSGKPLTKRRIDSILGKDDLATDPDTGLKLDHARLEDLEDPARQIKDYVQRVLTNYVTFSIDLFFAAEKVGEQWKFRTLKDEKGQPVVREITDEDIDAIGPAVWEDCNPPDEDEE